METYIKIAQFVLALSILIFVHEMGHFLFARLFKIRIDKFYLFFNPYFSVVRAKRIDGRWRFSWFSSAPPEAWKAHPDKTEWGLGWLPIGGFCKIAGMVDESMDKDQLKQPPQAWEYRTKPAWQRMFVTAGGVLFNLFLAILVFWGMLFTWGEQYLANKDAVYGVHCDSLAQEMGFRNGDKIVYLDGEPVESFFSIAPQMLFNQTQTATVLRGADTIALSLDNTQLNEVIKSGTRLFHPRMPFVVSGVLKNSVNANSGLQQGDRVVGIDSLPLSFYDEIQTELLQHRGQTVQLQVQRNATTLAVAAQVNKDGKIEVSIDSQPAAFFHLTQIDYGFFQAFPAGITKCYHTVVDYLKQLKLIFSPKTEAYKSVGSFITIANIFPGQWDWQIFWNWTAFLSIMLAVLNILPIPVLDGGHLLFTLYEIIARRPVNEKVYEIALRIGFILLVGLMVLALGNDFIRFVL